MQLGAALVGLAWSPSRGLQTPQVVGLACLQQTTSYSPGNKLCAHLHTRAMLQIIFCLLNRTLDTNSCYKSLNNLKSPKIS